MKAKYSNGREVKFEEKKQVIFNGKEYTLVARNGGSVRLEGNGERFTVHESKVQDVKAEDE